MNNRQAGRRRGRGGQRQGGNPGRPENGNRIDNRARGNAAQLLEKYKSLASDAQRQGDRVNTEYYLQFADHYFRVLSESRSRYEEQNQRRPRDDDAEDGDDDFGFEGEQVSVAQQSRQGRDRDADFDGEDRDNGNRRERTNGYRRERNDEPREARPAPAPANDASDDEQAEAPVETPRRRGRPRRDAVVVAEDAGLDVDRLPPSLGVEASTEDAAAAERPRRGRPRKPRVDDEAAPAA